MTASHQKVVARYTDGRLVKGYAFDFRPPQPRFHLFSSPSAIEPSVPILLRELKAVFFVRDFDGNPARRDRKLSTGQGRPERAVEVRFRDGEVIEGIVEGDSVDDPGFFLVPTDTGSNNLRVYVVTAATRAVYQV